MGWSLIWKPLWNPKLCLCCTGDKIPKYMATFQKLQMKLSEQYLRSCGTIYHAVRMVAFESVDEIVMCLYRTWFKWSLSALFVMLLKVPQTFAHQVFDWNHSNASIQLYSYFAAWNKFKDMKDWKHRQKQPRGVRIVRAEHSLNRIRVNKLPLHNVNSFFVLT